MGLQLGPRSCVSGFAERAGRSLWKVILFSPAILCSLWDLSSPTRD